MKWMHFALVTLCCCSGCDYKAQEKALKDKEAVLIIKEQQLNERELLLRQAEGAFEQKQKIDSSDTDSVFLIQNNILGSWNTRMICTQATCTGSAIGDTKNEVWTFVYNNNLVLVKASAGDKLIRIYTGKVVNNTIELVENIEPTADEPATKIAVRLKIQNERALDGQREILRPDCKIVYSLQLSR